MAEECEHKYWFAHPFNEMKPPFCSWCGEEATGERLEGSLKLYKQIIDEHNAEAEVDLERYGSGSFYTKRPSGRYGLETRYKKTPKKDKESIMQILYDVFIRRNY